MAIPLAEKWSFTPEELSFVAENAYVDIIPRQRLQRVQLVSSIVPETTPPRRAALPLWLALLLRRQRRVNIIPPDWMLPESLEDFLRQEEEHPNKFAALPFAWLEIGHLLLDRLEFVVTAS